MESLRRKQLAECEQELRQLQSKKLKLEIQIQLRDLIEEIPKDEFHCLFPIDQVTVNALEEDDLRLYDMDLIKETCTWKYIRELIPGQGWVYTTDPEITQHKSVQMAFPDGEGLFDSQDKKMANDASSRFLRQLREVVDALPSDHCTPGDRIIGLFEIECAGMLKSRLCSDTISHVLTSYVGDDIVGQLITGIVEQNPSKDPINDTCFELKCTGLTEQTQEETIKEATKIETTREAMQNEKDVMDLEAMR